MAVEGKKRVVLYLTESNVTIINQYLDKRQGAGGLSGLVDEYLATIAKTLENAGLTKGNKITLVKLIKMGLHGFKNRQDIK